MAQAIAYPDVRLYELRNHNTADTIYPLLFDENNNLIWDGQKYNHDIGPGSIKTLDLNNITGGPKSQTVLILGCSVKDTSKQLSDPANKVTYKQDSQNTAPATYDLNGIFKVVALKPFGLEAAALQDAYIKLNNPGVSKLLKTLADLIHPQLV